MYKYICIFHYDVYLEQKIYVYLYYCEIVKPITELCLLRRVLDKLQINKYLHYIIYSMSIT